MLSFFSPETDRAGAQLTRGDGGGVGGEKAREGGGNVKTGGKERERNGWEIR